MIRILLADDHLLLVEGLRSLLERHSNVEISGVARDGIEAVSLAFQHHPNIILMDISMPQLNGLDATRKILRDLPDTNIIMLSMHADRRYIEEALRLGARGYMLKESATRELLEAITQVQKGGLYFSESVRDQVLHDYVDSIRDIGKPPSSPLSVREREVLQLLAEGKATRDIAGVLNVSIKTIESHRKQIMDKLRLYSIAELTKYAVREGLTQLE